MHEQQAVLLMVARELMSRCGLRRKICRVTQSPGHYLAFGASNKTLYLPVIHRGTKASILSLLESTGAKTTRWLFNGQAHQGVRQLHHFGDSGACFLVFSQQALLAGLMSQFGCDYEGTMTEWRRAEVRNAPEQSRLFLRRSDDDLEMIELPPDHGSNTIYRALTQGVQEIDPVHWEQIRGVVSKGFQLESVIDGDRILLGRPHQLASHTMKAA